MCQIESMTGPDGANSSILNCGMRKLRVKLGNWVTGQLRRVSARSFSGYKQACCFGKFGIINIKILKNLCWGDL